MKLLNYLNNINFRKILLLLPIIFIFHQLEEWNILEWFNMYFPNYPESTNLTMRTYLIFASIIGFMWTFFSLIFKNIKITIFVILPFIFLSIKNGLQHIYWLFYFFDYAPGVIFAGFIGIPFCLYLIFRSYKENNLHLWYLIINFIIIIPSLFNTIKLGNNITPQFQKLNTFSIWLAKIIFGHY